MRILILTIVPLLFVAGCGDPPVPAEIPGTYRTVGFLDDSEVTFMDDGQMVLNDAVGPNSYRWTSAVSDDQGCTPLEIRGLRPDGPRRRLVGDPDYVSHTCATRIVTGGIRIMIDPDMGLYLDRISDPSQRSAG